MEQRNTNTNQMNNLQHDQQAHNRIRPQPSVPSGSTSNNTQPSMNQRLPVPISYPMTQYNAVHNHPLAGNSAPVTTSNYYNNPYMTLPSSSLYPSQVNQGPRFVDGLGGAFKGKSSEGYSNSAVGPSSMVPLSAEDGSQQNVRPGPFVAGPSSMVPLSVEVGSQQRVRPGPVVVGPRSMVPMSAEVESERSVRPGPVVAGPSSRSVEVESRRSVRPGPFVAGPSSMVPLSAEVGSQQRVRPGPVVAGPSSMVPMSAEVRSELSVRPGPVGGETVLAQNSNHLIQGNFQGHVLIPTNAPWGWTQAPAITYMNGYPALLYPLQGHFQPLHQLPQPVHLPLYSHETGSSYGPVIRSSSNTNPNLFQIPMHVGPGFVGPAPRTGLGIYNPTNERPLAPGVTMRPHTLPNLSFLPADGVAILEVPSRNQIVNSVDQHSTMRMDVDGMSYEELLALGERIGSVGTGLSEDTISSHLQTRTYASSASSPVTDDTSTDSCIICLSNFENQEKVGKLECGHEYHVDCVKKWLVNKNTCPICKCTALTI